MGIGNQFIERIDSLKDSTTESGNGTGTLTVRSDTSRAIELWITVTGSPSGTLAVIVESSIDGTNFVEQKRVSGITAAGATSMVLNRADHALGTTVRVSWEISGGSLTFKVDAGRME